MTRRNLLKSIFAGAAALPVLALGRKAEPVAVEPEVPKGTKNPYRDQFRLLETGAVPNPLEGSGGQTHFSGYIVLAGSNPPNYFTS